MPGTFLVIKDTEENEAKSQHLEARDKYMNGVGVVAQHVKLGMLTFHIGVPA